MSDAPVTSAETEPAHEWITIPEAARRLGLSERQTRRMAGRLPDMGRTDAGQSPQRVRLDLLQELRPNVNVRATAPDSPPDSGATNAGQRPDTPDNQSDGKDALIEQLRAENGRLWAALEREQASTKAALDELHEARRESQVLLAATATGRISLPPTTVGEGSATDAGHGPDTMQNVPQEATGDDLRADTGAGGQSVNAPWWAFWKAKSQ